MSLSLQSLEQLNQLAYLENNLEENPALAQAISSILDFVEQLQNTDVSHVAPLFHPMDLTQRLRTDNVTEIDCSEALSAVAPCFDEASYYLVPRISQEME